MRRVLFLTYHFPPSGASGSHRLLGFARYLPLYGWSAVVVAPPKLPWEALDTELGRQVPADTVVYPVPHELSGLAALPLRMLAYYAMWIPRAWPASARAIRRHGPSCVLTSGPPHTIQVFGLLMKLRFGLPWIADFRDPWVAGTSGRGVRRRFAAAAEALVMDRADAIVANAPNAAELIRAHYPTAADRVVTITNGYDPERFATFGAAAEDVLEIVHPGQIYAGRDPRPFLDALRRVLSDRPAFARPLRTAFIGDLHEGRRAFLLADEIRMRNLAAHVEVRGHVPYASALQAMQQASILLLLDSPGRRIGVPAKLYEYIGAGRPILALCDPAGDTAWVLRESGAVHRIAEPESVEQIGSALESLLRLVESGSVHAWSDGRRAFTRKVLAGQLADVLASCVASEHADIVPRG